MKKTILLIFVLGMCIIVDAEYQAQSSKTRQKVRVFEDGNGIYTMLQPKGDEMESDLFYAFGYIIGVHDASNDTLFSRPKEVTSGQVIDVVKKYLETHPEVRHLSAESIIINALKEAFPKKEPPAFP